VEPLSSKKTNYINKSIEETPDGVETVPKGQTRDSKEETEFSWNVHDFPKPKKTQDIDFAWGENEVRTTPDQTENLDKFFNFDSKKEEFQKLLDQEYEKIRGQEPEAQNNATRINRIEEAPVVITEELVIEEPVVVENTIIEEEPEVILPDMHHNNEDEQTTQDIIDDEVLYLKNEGSQVPKPDVNQPLPPLWFDTDDEDERGEEQKRKSYISRAILILIILILLAEVTALGIKYFWPDSPAATTVTSIQITIAATLNDWKDDITNLFEGLFGDKEPTSGDITDQDDPDPNPVEDPDPEQDDDNVPVDTAPTADKSALIESQMSHNKNIQTVRANNALAYVNNKDYELADINSSKPIENNLWRPLMKVKSFFMIMRS
jgi:hypothetical protein